MLGSAKLAKQTFQSMPMQNINALLFDLDGTILDSQLQDHELVTRLFRDLLKKNATPDEIASCFGMSSRKILEEVAPDRIEELMPLLADIQREISGLAMVFPGMRSMIRRLSEAGFGLAVVTSKTREELTISRNDYDLPEEIEVWVGADDAHAPKPDPAPVLLAMELLGCAPNETVMIGDTYFDMEAGRAAGVKIGAALWGEVDRERLLSYKPDFLFETADELEGFLQWKKS